jgi:predicted component of type VI protein secretion system
MEGKFRFTFGPWNIHEGGDPFGPAVRQPVEFGKKLAVYKKLGFDGVQFHDDDAVPDMNDLTPQQIINKANEIKKILDDHGWLRNLLLHDFGKMNAQLMGDILQILRIAESMQSIVV